MRIIAIDQYGRVECHLGKYPRKELMERYATKHVEKIYREHPEGDYHCGYIVRGHWFTLYQEMNRGK